MSLWVISHVVARGTCLLGQQLTNDLQQEFNKLEEHKEANDMENNTTSKQQQKLSSCLNTKIIKLAQHP